MEYEFTPVTHTNYTDLPTYKFKVIDEVHIKFDNKVKKRRNILTFNTTKPLGDTYKEFHPTQLRGGMTLKFSFLCSHYNKFDTYCLTPDEIIYLLFNKFRFYSNIEVNLSKIIFKYKCHPECLNYIHTKFVPTINSQNGNVQMYVPVLNWQQLYHFIVYLDTFLDKIINKLLLKISEVFYE